MKFTLHIHSSPSQQPSARTALQFAETLLQQGHTITTLFFFHDGVYHGSKDDNNPWQSLIQKHNLDAILCSASAGKRGLFATNPTQKTEGKTEATIAEGFTLSGLGQLVSGLSQSDRTVTFG